jgi:hypothetical protein
MFAVNLLNEGMNSRFWEIGLGPAVHRRFRLSLTQMHSSVDQIHDGMVMQRAGRQATYQMSKVFRERQIKKPEPE